MSKSERQPEVARACRKLTGVTVRIVVDALGSKDCGSSFWKPVVDAGGNVRQFNPPYPFKPQPGKLNFRTHRKIVIVDGHRAFTGGINISDHNDTATGHDDKRAWRNTHLEIVGAPVRDLQAIFLEDWLYGLPIDAVEVGKRDARTRRPNNDEEPELPSDIDRWFPELSGSESEHDDGPWVQIIDSGPDEADDDIHLLYFSAISCARERLWITTPYFIPDAPIQTALESAVARGVDVRLIIPANSDSKIVEAAAKTFSTDVVRKGARIWRYGPRMNHSKTMIVDDGLAIVGTANMDNRSFRLNFEVVAAIYDRQITARVADIFERDLADSTPYEPEGEDAGFVQRVITNTARLLAPLL